MLLGILIFSEPKFEQFSGVERLTQVAIDMGHEVIHLYEPFFSISGDQIWYEGKVMPKVDIIIARPNFIEEPGLHAHVVRALAVRGFRIINGLFSYGSVKNKIEQMLEFDRLQIPYPRSIICKKPEYAILAAREIGFPVIIKVAFGTIGSGVFYAENEETLSPIADYLQIRDRNPIIIQTFITEANRKDLRVFVVGEKIVAAMQRTAPERDVRANATRGGTGSSVTLTSQEQALALEVTKNFRLEIAGVDLIRSDRGPLVLEINANPGFVELERVTHVDVAKAIIEYAVSMRPFGKATKPVSTARAEM